MSLAFRLSVVYGALCLFGGVYLPFFPVWLKSRGLDASEIALVLALSVFLRIVVSPFFASIADRSGDRRKVIIWLSWGSLASCAMLLFVEGFGPILLVALVLNAIYPSIMPILETVAMRARNEQAMNYGRVRLWGSVTFVVASVIVGWLLDWNTSSIIAICLVASLAINLACMWLLPAEPAKATPETAGTGRRFAGALALCCNPIFMLFVFAASLTQATHAVYYAFGSLAWQKQGYSDVIIGLLWGTGVLAEIVLFYVSGPLMARLGAVRLLAIAGVATLLRWGLIALSPPLAIVFLTQGLHALTFGAAHLGAVQFVAQSAPVRLSSTAQSLYSAISSGLVMGSVTMAIGPLYGLLGSEAYFLMAGLGAIALTGTIIVGLRWDGSLLVPEEEGKTEDREKS